MSKKLTFLLLLIFGTTVAFSQAVKKEAPVFETKMDKFTSKTGAFSKFIDSKLTTLKLKYGESANTRVRKVIVGTESIYFYEIEKPGQYSNTTAAIEYSDLLEVIKALGVLKVEVDKDIASNPDYLENKFITVDGFQIGYFVSKGSASWYVKLEKYGSDNTIFLKDEPAIEDALNEGRAKIEALKK